MASIVHDRELLDALEAITPERFSGFVWRCSWAGRDPLIGSVYGGRWHPEKIEGLYTSLEIDGALAEIDYHLSRLPVFASSASQVHRLQVTDLQILRLGAGTLETLGVELPFHSAKNYERTQAIGGAAFFLEHAGLIVPSARWNCSNLLVFNDRIEVATTLNVTQSEDVNWPAWHSRAKGTRAS